MDNPRLFLWIGLALLAWMNVIQWNRDYGAGPAVATAPAASNSAATPAGRGCYELGRPLTKTSQSC